MKKMVIAIAAMMLVGCYNSGSDTVQQEQQEKILNEATNAVGMPAIKNFRERRILKDILELRDQEGLVTYTYVVNEIPKVEVGRTILGGKFTYIGETIGFGIPYSTQYTNPYKLVRPMVGGEFHSLPQADPNALFSPESAEGTWILMKDPNSSKVLPIYMEPRIAVFPFKMPFDGVESK